jgi:hypothetical protein
MKFEPKTRSLYAENGELLKTLNCPLDKNWDALLVEKNTPLKRYCNSCDNHVVDITEFTEQQVIDLLKIDADSCICVRRNSSHVQWINESRAENPERKLCMTNRGETIDGCRVVKTARNAIQIESNKDGYVIIVKAVEINEHIKEKVVIQYDERGFSGYDFRMMPSGITNWWHSLKSISPFAAYLVSKDVEPGEKVFVPDIIEDFIETRWNQGDVYRLNEGFGIFTGEDIEFDYPTELDEVGELMG